MKNIRGALFVLSLSIILLFNSTTIAQAKAPTIWVCSPEHYTSSYQLIKFKSLKLWNLEMEHTNMFRRAFDLLDEEEIKKWETKILNEKNCKNKIENQSYKRLYGKIRNDFESEKVSEGYYSREGTREGGLNWVSGPTLFAYYAKNIDKDTLAKLSKKYNEYPLKNLASTTQIAKKEPTETQQVVKSAIPECKGNNKNISKYSKKYLKKVRKWTNCHGTFIGKNGSKYVGEFQGGGFSGQGTFTWGDGEFAGDKYVGEFLKNRRSGLGTYTFANGNIDHGIWAQGKLIERIETEIKVAKKEPTQTQQVAKTKIDLSFCKVSDYNIFALPTERFSQDCVFSSGGMKISYEDFLKFEKKNWGQKTRIICYNARTKYIKSGKTTPCIKEYGEKRVFYENGSFYYASTETKIAKKEPKKKEEKVVKKEKKKKKKVVKKEKKKEKKVAKKKTGIFWKTEQSWKCKLFGLCGPEEKTQQVAKKEKKKTEQVAKKIINIYCVKNNYSAIRMEIGEKPNCKNGEFKVVKNEYLLLETVYDSLASYFDLNDPNEVALFDRRVRDIFKTTHQDFNKLTDTQQVAKIESTKKTFNLLDLLKKEEKKITIKEVLDLGKYTEFNAYPEGMLKEFKNCKKMFCRGKVAGKRVYEIFAKRSELWHQRHPGDIIHGMAWFEIFYLEKLRKNEKQITRYIKNGPKGYSSKNIMDKMVMRKDISSLHGLIKTNKGRIKMREALGLSLNDDLETVLKRHWLLGDFLNKDKLKVKKVKINSDMKKRKKLLAEYKSALTRYKNKLEEERRATN